jgi:hypothetical protein
MLIQIGENSATLTPFGSLASAGHSADGDGAVNNKTVRHRPISIKLAWRWICNLFPVTWRRLAVKTH